MKNEGFFSHETAIIDVDVKIGRGTRIWHFSHIMSNSEIGENCNIGQNVMIASHVNLGSNVKVQNNVSIYTGVQCEDDVFLGPSMVFTNILNPRSAVHRRDQYRSTIVKKGATIGANSTILCGNTIEKYTMIGAGAVLTRSTVSYALVLGNPARQVGWVSEYGHTLHFDRQGIAICPESNQEYKLDEGRVFRMK